MSNTNGKKMLTTENLTAIFGEVKSYVDSTPGSNCTCDGSALIVLDELDTDENLTATATTPVNFDHQTFNAIIQKCVQACEANTKPKLKMAYDGVYTRYCEILSMTIGEDKDYVYLDVVCDGKLYTIRLTDNKGYATLNSSGAPALDYATATEVETEADKVFTNNK